MRLFPTFLACALALACATPAAALAERGCRYETKVPGKPLPFAAGPLDEPSRLGLSAAVLLALGASDRATWPDAEVEASAPCPFKDFHAAGVDWTLSGGAGPAPVRFVHSAAREDYLFLALGPTMAEGHAWFLAGADDPLTLKQPVYYLVRATAGPRLVYRAYDGIPASDELAKDAADAVEGRLRPVAIFDPRGQAVTVQAPTQSGVQAQLFGPEDHPANVYGPDGTYFAAAGGEAAKMRGSGLICPAALGPLVRNRLLVVNRTEAGLDLGCGFGGEESWISLFVTREPTTAIRAAFEERLTTARKEGFVRALPTAVKGMDAGQAWLDGKSAGQGLWMARRGPYLVEARATFAPQDQAAIERAIATIAASAADIPER